MAGEGYIKVQRSIVDSPVFANAETLKVALWAMCRARRTKRTVSLRSGRGVHDVVLQAGQFLYGRNSAAERLCLSPSTVDRRMKSLEKLGFLERKVNRQYTVVTVCNFTRYQDGSKKSEQADEQLVNNQRTSGEQLVNTNKRDIEVSRGIKNISLCPRATELRDLWNATSARRESKKITKSLAKKFATRLAEPGWYEIAKQAIGKFPLRLFASDPDGWQPDLEWFLRPDSASKIVDEKKYDWSKSNGKSNKPGPGQRYVDGFEGGSF